MVRGAVQFGSFEPEGIDDDLAALTTKTCAARDGSYEQFGNQRWVNVLIEQQFELAVGPLAGWPRVTRGDISTFTIITPASSRR